MFPTILCKGKWYIRRHQSDIYGLSFRTVNALSLSMFDFSEKLITIVRQKLRENMRFITYRVNKTFMFMESVINSINKYLYSYKHGKALYLNSIKRLNQKVLYGTDVTYTRNCPLSFNSIRPDYHLK